MTPTDRIEIFLAAAPGAEGTLRAEALARGFSAPKAVAGGVTFLGRWQEVWRANLEMRCTNRVLARIASFPAPQMADLETRAAQVPWHTLLRRDVPVSVEATCRASRIYHSGAAAERVANAIAAKLGAPIADDAPVSIRVRLDNDQCSLSVDTSGELLHRRGSKQAVAKAPMRETLAAVFLRQCGYDGREPVLDPMCGSGTFVIEAAEIAAGLLPGRARNFAFEQLATFDAEAWQELRAKRIALAAAAATSGHTVAGGDGGEIAPLRFYGSDRDAGAIDMSRANADRAGVAATTQFETRTVSEIVRPDGPPGLVMVNPPYGDRIGDRKQLQPLYRALGQNLKQRFTGWRVGIIATDATLAHATELPFVPNAAPVAHGGLRVTLFHTPPLP